MENKSKYKLIKEVIDLRQQIIQLEKSETARKKSEYLLKKSEQRYRLIVENANEAILVIQNNRFRFFNRKASEITGYSKEEFAAKPFGDFFHPSDKSNVMQRHIRRMSGENFTSADTFRIVNKEREIRWIESNSVMIEWEGEPACLYFMTDITERKQAEEALRESESRYRTLFEFANDAIFLETEAQDIVDVNDRACEMFGYSRQELVNMKTADLRQNSEDTLPSYLSPYLSLDTPVEMIAMHKDGRRLCIEFTVTPLVSGRQTLFMTIARDNTERREAEEKIKYLALHDKLTGLPNRNLLSDRLSHALSRGHRYRHIVAVLFIDLDGFKPINDELGHQAGDEVLKTVADRLRGCIRETDTVARLGGDEFVVILQDIQKKACTEIIAKRLIRTVNQPIRIREKACVIGLSIGISTYPSDGENADMLLQKADAAMYQVKEKGKNSYLFYGDSEKDESPAVS